MPASCPWDCGNFNGDVGIEDFLKLIAEWGMECTPCDQTGGPGVDIDDFLALLAAWGSCTSGPPPPSIEEVVTEAGLVYPQDWDAFVDAMTDPNVSKAEKDNWRCWMDHYLDCHRRPFCAECACLICPDVDPYGNHFPFP